MRYVVGYSHKVCVGLDLRHKEKESFKDLFMILANSVS